MEGEVRECIRVLQKKKYIYLRGHDGWKSWFKPVRYEAPTSYAIQTRNEAGEWTDIPVVVEFEGEGASYGG